MNDVKSGRRDRRTIAQKEAIEAEGMKHRMTPSPRHGLLTGKIIER